VVREDLSAEDQQRWAAAAARLVTAAFPHGSNDVATWPACVRLLPHALAVVDYAQKYGVEPVATGLLLNEAGFYLWSRGQYQQARPLHEQALAIRRRELGDDDPDTLQSMNSLALTRRQLGDLQSTYELFEQTLADRRLVLGGDHPDTLASMNTVVELRRELDEL
jgi:tetratricopeptide (TPR) repeat protein